MKIPNVKVQALVPADFEQHAARLGYTVEEMLWLLAERLCVDPPPRVEIVRLSNQHAPTPSARRRERKKRQKASRPLEVSDKVVLHRHWMPADLKGLKPRLKRGRVYCVRYVYRAASGTQYVRLAGVTCPAGECGGETAILAGAFSRVSKTGVASEGKGEA